MSYILVAAFTIYISHKKYPPHTTIPFYTETCLFFFILVWEFVYVPENYACP